MEKDWQAGAGATARLLDKAKESERGFPAFMIFQLIWISLYFINEK
ncbi:hypothetical protein [Candidatus Protochlamydia phocaeensis]|nr:hypothetical protein [Candidatus Protochlamydia phocaeensis]